MADFESHIPSPSEGPSEPEAEKFVPATAEELAEFAAEFGGERQQSMRDQLCSFLGRESIDRRYPDEQAGDLSNYIQFVGQASITESRNLDELITKGTIFGGMAVSAPGLDRYRLARLDFRHGAPDLSGDGE